MSVWDHSGASLALENVGLNHSSTDSAEGPATSSFPPGEEHGVRPLTQVRREKLPITDLT